MLGCLQDSDLSLKNATRPETDVGGALRCDRCIRFLHKLHIISAKLSIVSR